MNQLSVQTLQYFFLPSSQLILAVLVNRVLLSVPASLSSTLLSHPAKRTNPRLQKQTQFLQRVKCYSCHYVATYADDTQHSNRDEVEHPQQSRQRNKTTANQTMVRQWSAAMTSHCESESRCSSTTSLSYVSELSRLWITPTRCSYKCTYLYKQNIVLDCHQSLISNERTRS